jgi:hypothetical protein
MNGLADLRSSCSTRTLRRAEPTRAATAMYGTGHARTHWRPEDSSQDVTQITGTKYELGLGQCQRQMSRVTQPAPGIGARCLTLRAMRLRHGVTVEQAIQALSQIIQESLQGAIPLVPAPEALRVHRQERSLPLVASCGWRKRYP